MGPRTRVEIRDLDTHDSVARTLAFDDDETHLAVGFADGAAAVYATADGTTVASWQAHEADVWARQGRRPAAERRGRTDPSGSSPRRAPRSRRATRGEFQPIVALAVHPSGESVRASIGGPRAELLELDLLAPEGCPTGARRTSPAEPATRMTPDLRIRTLAVTHPQRCGTRTWCARPT